MASTAAPARRRAKGAGSSASRQSPGWLRAARTAGGLAPQGGRPRAPRADGVGMPRFRTRTRGGLEGWNPGYTRDSSKHRPCVRAHLPVRPAAATVPRAPCGQMEQCRRRLSHLTVTA